MQQVVLIPYHSPPQVISQFFPGIVVLVLQLYSPSNSSLNKGHSESLWLDRWASSHRLLRQWGRRLVIFIKLMWSISINIAIFHTFTSRTDIPFSYENLSHFCLVYSTLIVGSNAGDYISNKCKLPETLSFSSPRHMKNMLDWSVAMCHFCGYSNPFVISCLTFSNLGILPMIFQFSWRASKTGIIFHMLVFSQMRMNVASCEFSVCNFSAISI